MSKDVDSTEVKPAFDLNKYLIIYAFNLEMQQLIN